MSTFLALALVVLNQTPENDAAEAKSILLPYYVRQAAMYEVFLDETRQQRLELQEQPVLTWTNADNYLGSVFCVSRAPFLEHGPLPAGSIWRR
jgi:hypothetical protein